MPESALANRNATKNRPHDSIPAKSTLALLRKGFSNPYKPTLNDRAKIGGPRGGLDCWCGLLKFLFAITYGDDVLAVRSEDWCVLGCLASR